MNKKDLETLLKEQEIKLLDLLFDIESLKKEQEVVLKNVTAIKALLKNSRGTFSSLESYKRTVFDKATNTGDLSKKPKDSNSFIKKGDIVVGIDGLKYKCKETYTEIDNKNIVLDMKNLLPKIFSEFVSGEYFSVTYFLQIFEKKFPFFSKKRIYRIVEAFLRYKVKKGIIKFVRHEKVGNKLYNVYKKL